MARVTLITKGHPFDRDAFLGVFDALVTDADAPVSSFRHVEHPEAQACFAGEPAHDEVVVFYDMPGLTFTGADPPLRIDPPPPALQGELCARLEAGQGMVFLHHAIAGWPGWDLYAEIVGGRFHYQPAELAGVAYPDSGYCHEVDHEVEVLQPDHPLAAGLPERFRLRDELYLFPVFEDRVDPIFRSGHDFVDTNFWSADRAIRGSLHDREGWSHPAGSALVGWVKHAGNSPVAYLQFGDGPETYADVHYRRALANAIGWAATPEARAWARARRERTGRFA